MFTHAVDLPFATPEAPPVLHEGFAELRETVRPFAGDDNPETLTETFWSGLHGLMTLMRHGSSGARSTSCGWRSWRSPWPRPGIPPECEVSDPLDRDIRVVQGGGVRREIGGIAGEDLCGHVQRGCGDDERVDHVGPLLVRE